MDYRKYKDTYYIRIDKHEEIISSILDVCRKEGIASAYFTGIGGCSDAQLQTFIPETGEFETECIEGMLELLNITGDVVSDEKGELFHHTHAIYSFIKDGSHVMAGGHIKSTQVLYTAEIELRPVYDGVIRRKYDEETGTGFWDF